MRDKLAPVIEGFDCDKITNPWSFQSETFFEDGGNGGTMIDGKTVHDVLATKQRFSWTLNVLTMARYNTLITALHSGSELDTVSATVFNPEINARYSAMFHVTPPTFRFVVDNSGALVALASGALVLEESGEHAADMTTLILPDGTTPTSEDLDEIFDQFQILQEIIWIASYPTKRSYSAAEHLDYSGLIVMRKESGSEEQDITSECVLTPANGTRLTQNGNLTLKIQYNNRIIGEFTVSVAGSALPALQIYVDNNVLVISGEAASVSGSSLSIVSDEVSVSNNVFRSDTT